MTAYYNEFDKSAAAWLRELIKAGHITHGGGRTGFKPELDGGCRHGID